MLLVYMSTKKVTVTFSESVKRSVGRCRRAIEMSSAFIKKVTVTF